MCFWQRTLNFFDSCREEKHIEIESVRYTNREWIFNLVSYCIFFVTLNGRHKYHHSSRHPKHRNDRMLSMLTSFRLFPFTILFCFLWDTFSDIYSFLMHSHIHVMTALYMYQNSIENRWKKTNIWKTLPWTRNTHAHNNQLHFDIV